MEQPIQKGIASYHVGGVRTIELSDLDKEAIKIRYGERLKSGADREEMKKTLELKT
ncbi:MAG TPA: hypothetical protein PK024_11760 [Methanospirillum sp.]|uniref:hypothetical protein n=1 Tax=Methanospirillum sp. TaxID=45200 RepID=UPI002C807997|nr:hypothetical protein [Methanospirillum sp.]HOJ97497.1 hypothetical protein [Methanospirillum sp.]